MQNTQYEVTISPEKIILQREKEQCAIFIRAFIMWSLRLGLIGAMLRC